MVLVAMNGDSGWVGGGGFLLKLWHLPQAACCSLLAAAAIVVAFAPSLVLNSSCVALQGLREDQRDLEFVFRSRLGQHR